MDDTPDSSLSDAQRLSATALWRSVDQTLLERMLEDGDTLDLPPESVLFDAGEAHRGAVYVHLSGELEQCSTDGDHRQVEPGSLLGVANYLDGGRYRSTVEAITSSRVLALSDDTVRRLEQSSAGFFEVINRALAARMRRALQVRESVRGALARPARLYMQSGLATCTLDTRIAQASDLLNQRQVTSLGVVDTDNRLLGLVTANSLLTDLVTAGVTPADQLADCNLLPSHSITPETPLWQVEELQRRHAVRDVVVVDELDAPIGLVSQFDIVHALAHPPFTLESDIRRAADLDRLARLRQRIPAAARGVHETHRSAGEAVRAITEMHLAIQHRTVELVIDGLREDGFGAPPCRFTVIIMGSGGRGEMLLNPDQDNGLIIDNRATETELDWFREFAERLNPALATAGYRLCPGDVMARNPAYRLTLDGWKDWCRRLIRQPGRREARQADIALDFATLYGDDGLTAQLREHLNRELRDDAGRALFRRMVGDNARINHPLGLFNRLLTTSHQGSEVIDLKRTGLRLIVDALRVFALNAGVSRCKTLERLAALRRLGVFEPDFSETIRIAFEELQDLLLTHQLAQTRRGETPDPLLRMERLSSHERERLRLSLRASRRVREHLQQSIGLIWR